MSPTLFIPYMFFGFWLHKVCKYISKDIVLADFAVPIFYNIAYLTVVPALWYKSIYPEKLIAEHVISALIGWYSVDTANLLSSTYKSRYIYIFHHVVSLNLLLMHYFNILPMSVGKIYLTLFEASNIFLLPYQLCLHKGWTKTRYFLTKPMVLTYVPLRLFAIPLCSLTYYESLNHLNIPLLMYCLALLCLINIFSMGFGAVIVYKYSLYLKKLVTK